MTARLKVEEDSATIVEATTEPSHGIGTLPKLETRAEAQKIMVIKDDDSEVDDM